MKQVATLGSFEISESGNQDISESDKRLVLQSNMCRLDNGTMVSPSGVYASSICLED